MLALNPEQRGQRVKGPSCAPNPLATFRKEEVEPEPVLYEEGP